MLKVKKVLGDKVVLVSPPLENKREGGFIIPTESENIGLVKFIGEEIQAKAQELGLESGQKVIFAGNYEKVRVENQDAWVCKLDNVVAILE